MVINRYLLVIQGVQMKQIQAQQLIQGKKNIPESSNNFWAGISELLDENQRRLVQHDR